MNTRRLIYWLMIIAGLIVAIVAISTNQILGVPVGVIMTIAGLYYTYREYQRNRESSSEG